MCEPRNVSEYGSCLHARGLPVPSLLQVLNNMAHTDGDKSTTLPLYNGTDTVRSHCLGCVGCCKQCCAARDSRVSAAPRGSRKDCRAELLSFSSYKGKPVPVERVGGGWGCPAQPWRSVATLVTAGSPSGRWWLFWCRSGIASGSPPVLVCESLVDKLSDVVLLRRIYIIIILQFLSVPSSALSLVPNSLPPARDLLIYVLRRQNV